MLENERKHGFLELILLGTVVALFAYQMMKPQLQAEQARTAQAPSQENPQTPSQGTPQTPSQENPQVPSQGNPQTADLSPLVGKWHGEKSTDKGKVAVWLSFQSNGTFQAKASEIGADNKDSTVITMSSNTMEGSYQRTGKNSYVVETKKVCTQTCKPHTHSSEFTLNGSNELLGEGIRFRKTS